MRFKPGQMVQLTADPSREGSIIERLQPVGGINKYRVFPLSWKYPRLL